MSDLLERFRQLRLQSATTAHEPSGTEPAVNLGYPRILPSEHTTIKERGTDDWASKRASEIASKVSSMEIVIPELPPEFQNIDIPELVVTSNNDFPDDAWRGRAAIALGVLTNAEAITLGRSLIGALTSGVSQLHVGSIFSLAFQLKEPGNRVCLLDRDELEQPDDVSIGILDREVIETLGTPTTPTEIGSADEVAQGYAYLATSMLRMFTRPAENYKKSWTQINNGYKKFYSRPIPITGVTPLLGVLRQIHYHFSLSELMKRALYRFLYNANYKGGAPASIQKDLYDVQLSHTGMHALPIAFRICVTMNCSPLDLITVAYARRFHPQIRGLVAAFSLMNNKDESHRRIMWKYGRIFDSNFLAAIQTKTCPKFGYILACTLMESGGAHAGILGIKQFEEVGAEDRINLQKGSKLILEAIKEQSQRRCSENKEKGSTSTNLEN